MHPYRAPFVPDLDPELAEPEGGARLAFGVLALVGAVQVAIAVPHPFSGAMWFGAACVVAGLAWLAQHRDQVSGGRSRRRYPTPASVRSHCGRAGSASILRRSAPMCTRR